MDNNFYKFIIFFYLPSIYKLFAGSAFSRVSYYISGKLSYKHDYVDLHLGYFLHKFSHLLLSQIRLVMRNLPYLMFTLTIEECMEVTSLILRSYFLWKREYIYCFRLQQRKNTVGTLKKSAEDKYNKEKLKPKVGKEAWQYYE